MSYNWEKIFKQKSTKELYDIFRGRTTLTGEAIDFAKKELDNRGFNNQEMESTRISWQISELIKDERLEEHDVFNQNVQLFSSVNAVVFSGIIVIALLIALYINPDILTTYETLFTISVVIILAASQIIANKRRSRKKEQRRQKLESLLEKLKSSSDEETFTNYQKEFIQEREKLDRKLSRTKRLWTMLWIAGIVLILIHALIELLP